VEVAGDGHHFEAVIVSGLRWQEPRPAAISWSIGALGDRMREEIHACR
jgi:acid stress-induced BolA-like protein IbaG/YrbA